MLPRRPDLSNATLYRATAFGLTWHSDIILPSFADDDAVVTADTTPDIVVRRVSRLRERRLLMKINRGFLCRDGVRLVGEDASFDMIAGNLIEWTPGPGWSGTMPQAFGSTVAALVLAWRGAVPLHGSAIEIAGRAVLLLGRGGAGKSTLAASLTTHGARLISDDLSVLTGKDGRGAPALLAGRPGIRLNPAIAAFSGLDLASTPTNRGKVVVVPNRVASAAQVPLSLILSLRAAGEQSDALPQQLFRPFWMASLPGAAERVARLRDTEQRVMPRSLIPSSIRNARDFSRAGADVMSLIEACDMAAPDAPRVDVVAGR